MTMTMAVTNGLLNINAYSMYILESIFLNTLYNRIYAREKLLLDHEYKFRSGPETIIKVKTTLESI